MSRKASRPVLLYLLGEAPPAVKAEHGDYPSWFERAWGGPLDVFDGRDGRPAPDPGGFAGAIVTGSSRSLTQPEAWMDAAAAFVRGAHQRGTPLIGVCFGHQLIGHAFGARVVKNPRGWEAGTCAVDLAEAGAADPLFDGLPPTVHVNLTHEDMVEPSTIDPASPLRVLAQNSHTPVQALAAGEHVRGIQFHPEITGAVCRGYIEARRPLLRGQDPDALLRHTRDSPHALAVMTNFRRHFVERA